MICFTATTKSFAILAIIPLSRHRGIILTETGKQTNAAQDVGPYKTTKLVGFGRVQRTGLKLSLKTQVQRRKELLALI